MIAASLPVGALATMLVTKGAGVIRRRRERTPEAAKKAGPRMSEGTKTRLGMIAAALFFGLPFTAGGVLMAINAVRELEGGRMVAMLFASLLFLVPGLLALQAWRLIPQAWIPTGVNGAPIFGGGIAVLVGTFIILLSMGAPDEAFNAPRWVVAAAGAAFLLAGAAIIATESGIREPWRTLGGMALGSLLLTAFAAISVWAAIGPSPVFALSALILVPLAAACWWKTGAEVLKAMR